jgi:3-oxoadipate enol-lactonase
LPGAFDQHVADAAAFFEQELPALMRWTFTPDEARRILQPVLAVAGAASQAFDRIWSERHDLLLSWLPNAEPFVVPGATHLLQVQEPRAVANALAAFFARHPLPAA